MAIVDYSVGFHDTLQAYPVTAVAVSQGHWDTKFNYTFENFFHPFVGRLINRLNRKALEGVMDASWQQKLAQVFFDGLYGPTNSNLVHVDSFPEEIDVSDHGPYSNYNWELFFHIPLTIAVNLSRNQRFPEAQRWFHFIFDPTSNDRSVDPPLRFWRFIAFRQAADPKQIDELLALLSKPESDLTPDEKLLKDSILDGYTAILKKPFQPHAVARTRHVAYQYSVVMKYLDNLIAWGDFLFQQDTVEAINEATLRYVLAANLLGPRPQRIPPRGAVQPKTYAQLKALPMDALGNALVELEGQLPFNFAPPPSGSGDAASAGPLFGIGRTFYFCIPRNDKLLGYWDTVADRLFKIRNCMNIAGIVRPLALFDPPIDPGMLVKAAAAGIDIGSIVNGLTQPIGPVRSLPLIQKSLELCVEVRNLGAALLSALQSGDAEDLALLRQTHESSVHQIMRQVRFLAWKFAQEATQSLSTARDTVIERYNHYKRALGLPDDPNVTNNLKIKSAELNEDNFDDAYAALVGTYGQPVTLQKPSVLKQAGSTSPSEQSGASGSGQLYLTESESEELNSHLSASRDLHVAAKSAQTAAPILSLIPDINLNLHFWGLGGSSKLFGGGMLASAAKFAADILKYLADNERDQAKMSRRKGEHERRAQDYLREFNIAAHELMENGRQILTSLIAEQVAYQRYAAVVKQIENAAEMDAKLHDKFTNSELYSWMQGEVSRLYYEYYRFAFDTARKAEQTMKQELMRPELDSQSFVSFNYWDGGRKGLLSGEALHLDVKRMEMAYYDNNKRELELTRDVSLRQLDPVALLALQGTASCQFTIPEWLFDRDCSGQYQRRIKTVAVTVNSGAPAGTGIFCTLSLLSSSIRKSAILKDGEYLRQGANDDRFMDFAGAIQSIVTSTANQDSGMFETNLDDDRFLPFEGAGAISTWKLDLAKSYPAFDYSTITDVILTIRYRARLGVDPTKVATSLDDLFQQTADTGPNLAVLFILQQDFAADWTAFAGGAANFHTTIRRDQFPYFTLNKTITIADLQLYGANGTRHHATGDPATATSDLQANQSFIFTAAPDPAGPTQVLMRNATTPVFLLIRYSL